MNRLQHYIDSIKKCKNEDEIKGALTILLVEYSHNIISRLNNNTAHIMEWLEEEIKT